MKVFYCLLFFIFLTGCSFFQEGVSPSTQKYQEVLDQWLGKEKEDLISVWGVPSYDYMKKGINYIVYMKHKMKPVAEGNKIERMPRMALDFSFFKDEKATVSKGCTTVFIIEDDYIRQWRFEGAECQAY